MILGHYAPQRPDMSKRNKFGGGASCWGAGQTSKSSPVKICPLQRRAAALWAHGWATSAQDWESTWKTANASLNHWSTTGKQPIHTWALGSCPRPLNSYSPGSWPRFDYYSNGKKTTRYLIPAVHDYMLMMQASWTLQSAGGICC